MASVSMGGTMEAIDLLLVEYRAEVELEGLRGEAGPLRLGALLSHSDYTLTRISEVVNAWKTYGTKVLRSQEAEATHGVD